jgi:hypothetical protein
MINGDVSVNDSANEHVNQSANEHVNDLLTH